MICCICEAPLSPSEPMNEIRGLGCAHTECFADWMDREEHDRQDAAISANLDARKG